MIGFFGNKKMKTQKKLAFSPGFHKVIIAKIRRINSNQSTQSVNLEPPLSLRLRDRRREQIKRSWSGTFTGDHVELYGGVLESRVGVRCTDNLESLLRVIHSREIRGAAQVQRMG